MAPFWFLTGVLFTLAAIILLLPWLRTIPAFQSLPALPWPAGIGALVTLAAVLGVYRWLEPSNNPAVAQWAAHTAGNPPNASEPTQTVGKTPSASEPTVGKTPITPQPTADTWNDIASAMGNRSGGTTGVLETKPGAAPMSGAIASLQKRLSKGGGSADDWELLAKSYEFLGRAAEARQARAHQLPPLPPDEGASQGVASQQTTSAGPAGVVSGEVSLAAALKGKAVTGATLFILAKSVDSPGAPVAVFRTQVGSWPVKFELSDAQSMLPGRNLSNAARVTVEARISLNGQPLPAPGDLQGSTGVIRPADHQPVQIMIDKVIR